MPLNLKLLLSLLLHSSAADAAGVAIAHLLRINLKLLAEAFASKFVADSCSL